jgi:hypothetical protein
VSEEPNARGGSKQLWIFAVAAVIVGAIVAAVAVALSSSGDSEDEPEVAERASAEDDEALEEWFLDEDGEKPERAIEDVPAGDPARGWERGKRGDWRDPARRAERLRRRFQIESLGGSPAAITHEEVWEAFREVRPRMRECIEAGGGLEALRESFANRPRGGRTVRLDVGSDGRVVPGTVTFEPPPPDEIATCMKRELESATFQNTGPDGVRITMSMGRRRNRFSPDGGLERGERRRGEISPGSGP